MSHELDKLNKLADEVGNFIQYWGFKKVHGRVWTHLYLASEPLDASALMERLNISKSLVSITLNDLIHYKVIFRKGKGPNDTSVYVCNPEVRDVILEVLKNRELQIIEQVKSQYSEFRSAANSHIINKNRVSSLGSMISEADQALSAMVELKDFDFSGIQMG